MRLWMKIYFDSALSFQAQRSRCWQNQTAHPDLPWRCLCWFNSFEHTCRSYTFRWERCWWDLHSVSVSSAGTCINNTSVMMFKKGSFEIGCTVYPVAIKVRTSVCFPLSALCFLTSTFTHGFPSFSMTLGLGTPSGTAVSLAWWIICWGWWAAGPSSAASGTCQPWTKRWNSLSHYSEIFGALPESVMELWGHLLFVQPQESFPSYSLSFLCRRVRMQCSLPTESKQP